MTMTTPTQKELKDKLNEAIEKRMHVLGQQKVEAIDAIATSLDVKRRQIYQWLNEDVLPHHPEDIMPSLNTLIDEMGKFKSDSRTPAVRSTSFPFRVTITRQTLKVSQDAEGNITIHGSLSLDLL